MCPVEKFGFILFFIMVILDIVTNQNDIIADDRWLIWFIVAEDSIKLFAEAIFMIGFYHCFRVSERDLNSAAGN